MPLTRWIGSFLCLLIFVIAPISIGYSEENSSGTESQPDSHYNGDEFDTEERREEVEQYLEMPELYENTVIYNGVTHPDYNVLITRPSGTEDRPYVNENGQFSFVLFDQDDYEVGESITVFMSDTDGNPYNVELEIQSAVEGKEVVETEVQAEELERAIKDNTTIDGPQSGGKSIQVDTVGDVEQIFYGFNNDDPVSLQRQLEHAGGSIFQAFFTDLNPGEIIYFYIIASGITTVIEYEVPNQSTDSQPDDSTNQQENQDQVQEELNELSGILFQSGLKKYYEITFLLPSSFYDIHE